MNDLAVEDVDRLDAFYVNTGRCRRGDAVTARDLRHSTVLV